ncbi:unnamed protein product [Calicophoron daubneyi]|uniref:DDB1-and CUL4-associated factor 8 n=1 Tax=Calicophoron daubneyi TaxID=300641 RepID=A0AAV2TUA4_CALDB
MVREDGSTNLIVLDEGVATSSSSDDDVYTSLDDDRQWSYSVNSLNSLNLHPKDGDYSKYKKQLDSELRVGSAYYIGAARRPFKSSTDAHKASPDSIPTTKTSRAFLRHPLNLVLAREQGDLGPSSKSKRISYKASRWRVEGCPRYDGLQMWGDRAVGALNPDPQTFQESIQGSLWAVTRLHLENKFKCHTGCVNALCFNSVGNLIASGSDDVKVVVTNWITGERVAKYSTGHCMNIFHVKFLPETNDSKIVSCACDSEVRLANLSSDGSLVGSTRVLVAHNRACHKLALPQGEPNIVLSAGADGQVFSIDVRVPKADNILWLPFSEFFSVACNPVYPHEIALCGRSESIVRIYDRRKMVSNDPRSGYLHCFGADHLRSRERATPSVVVQNAGDASGDTDHEREGTNSDSELDEDSGTFLSSLSSQIGRRVRAVLSGLRGRARVALQFRDTSSRSPSNPSYDLEASRYSVTTAMYSAQGDALLASYNDEDIYLFDVRHPSHPYLHKYSGHRNMQTIVSASFFGPNSEYVVSGSDDGFFYMWDRESEGIVQWIHADVDGAVNVIESHPTLPVLTTAGLDFDFKVWSPLRPLGCDVDEADGNEHLKYTTGKVAPDILRLRRSRLAEAIFSGEPRATTRRKLNGIRKNSECEGSSLSSNATDNLGHPDQSDDEIVDVSASVAQSNVPNEVCTSEQAEDVSPDPVSPPTTSSRSKKRRRPSSSSGRSQLTDGTASAERDPSVATPNNVRKETEETSSGSSDVQLRKHRRRLSSSSLVSQKSGEMEVGSASNDPVDKSRKKTSKKKRRNSQKKQNGEANVHHKKQIRPSQSLLPFNLKDLELRVAQNWINRTCEHSQLDGWEADPAILSALESVAQLHARANRRRRAGRQNESDENSDDLDEPSYGSGIMQSILFVRRPSCPIERSEESRATRDRPEESTDSNSSPALSRNTSISSTDSSQHMASATVTISPSDSPHTPLGSSASSSSTLSTTSDGSEILELLRIDSAASMNSNTNEDSSPCHNMDSDFDSPD